MQRQTASLSLEEAVASVSRKMEMFTLGHNKVAIYMLGLTGSGKSTLINYLLGAKSKIKVVKKKGEFHMTNDDEVNFPVIGNGLSSCTDIPSSYAGLRGDVDYIDPAGFMDTKGDLQEIINGYANARMFKRGTRTKIVLTIEISTLLSGRGGNLPAIAKRLLDLFPRDYTTLINSIMIMVSKANPEDYTVEDILQKIGEISQLNQNMTPECKTMLDTIVYRKNVALFPLPRFLETQVINELRESIDSLPATVLQEDAHISLDHKAELMLLNLAKKISEDLKKAASGVRADLERLFVNVEYKNSEQLDPVIGRLKSALGILTNEVMNGNKFHESFQLFSESLAMNQQIASSIVACIKRIEFILVLKPSIMINNNNSLETIASAVAENIAALEKKMGKMATKEQIEEMNRRHDEMMRQRDSEIKIVQEEMRRSAQKREQQAKKALDQQRKSMEELMNKSNETHRKQIEQLKKKLQEQLIKNLPPPVPPVLGMNQSQSCGGGGGGPFEWYRQSATLVAKKFIIRSGALIDNIQVMLSDGNSAFYSPKFGSYGGREQCWQVPGGEWITQVEVKAGKFVDSITFITNKGNKSSKFGGDGGGYKLISFPENSRLVGIYGRAGQYIDQIGFYLARIA